MSLDLQQTYEQIKAATLAGGRGLRRLTGDEVIALQQFLQSADVALRHQALFIAAHSSHAERELETTLIKLMELKLSSEDMVWLLNALRKHVIQGRFKDGDRLTHEFLEALKKVLHHPDAAVVEWVLRTVEECGAQAIVFRGELAKIKPALWTLWRAQSRTILELVTFIERKWPNERSK